MKATHKTDCDRVLEEAIGKWYGILARFGIEVGNGRHRACPLCGGKDRFRFDNKENRGTWYCNQCGAGDGISLLMKKLNVGFIEACDDVAKIMGMVTLIDMNPEKRASPERLKELFMASRPIRVGDPVTDYLKNRGLSDFPTTLRYVSKCWDYESKQYFKAMLAIFHAADGEAITIHRTFLQDGKKAEIPSPKKTMPPKKPMKGGAVRLYQQGESMTLGICEGIETGIAVHQLFGCTVWATLSAQLMESFIPPAWAKKIEVYGDNDENCTGQKAAFTLANRLIIRDKIPTTVLISEENDFLDDLIHGKGMAKR